jgi:hypothetical protein
MDERSKPPESPRNGPGAGCGHSEAALHPSWRAFVQYCQEMGHGEIERLKIQDGIPVLVEVSRQKIKFS